jgi:hypothetical protein
MYSLTTDNDILVKSPDYHSSLFNPLITGRITEGGGRFVHYTKKAGKRKGYVFKEFNTEAQWNALLQIESDKSACNQFQFP